MKILQHQRLKRGPGKRPPGRKLSKEKARAKRQKSEDAHSSIGDRIVKSIDDMNASSAAKISKIAAQNAKDKQLGRRLKKIQMNKERIQSIKAMIEVETQLMEYDEKSYSKQPGLIGSPNDAKRRFAARHARIEYLIAQAQAFLAYNVEEPPEFSNSQESCSEF
ncbi:hypothetical protein Droror1_Dr00006216 [Drosera rotundifolia]